MCDDGITEQAVMVSNDSNAMRDGGEAVGRRECLTQMMEDM